VNYVNYFFKGTIDLTLFIRRFQDDILVSKYVLEILNKYGMESCDLVGTPMEIKDKLDLDQNGTPVDATKYRSMIGALMYLTSSRPDIVHATCLCDQHQARPTEKHLKEVKRIFSYLRGTINMGLWYTKDSGFELTGFSDADYAGCKDTFKSTSSGAQFLGEKLGNDLLTGNRGSNLYTISLQESTSSTPLCLMAKALPTQAWLWHRRHSDLNFDYINLLLKKDIMTGVPKLKYVKDQLCSSCELSKAKRSLFKSKAIPSSKGMLNLLHIDLCGPMRFASINGKKYILMIVDDYSRYTWTLFLRSKDETPKVLKEFLTMNQRNLQALVITNGVIERRNGTLVKAARTMLSALKLPVFFWVKAIATSCYTQNRSIVISTHEKTPYHIINDRKPSSKHLYIFGCICYITRYGENLDKMKEKGDPCILASDYDNPDPVPQRQDVSSLADAHVPSPQELDPLYGPLYDEFLNAGGEHLPDDELTNPFNHLLKQVRGNPSRPLQTRRQLATNPEMDHLLKQVRGNPSRPLQTRRQLATNPEIGMYVLTVSTAEPKNIKEAMADSAWIEAMQEELYHFDRLQFLLDFSSSAIFTVVASLFFWQWELSSLAVGTSSGSGNSITGSENALYILFPTILP
nr:hypothetical protein [Tanacetum cinerariifolium]